MEIRWGKPLPTVWIVALVLTPPVIHAVMQLAFGFPYDEWGMFRFEIVLWSYTIAWCSALILGLTWIVRGPRLVVRLRQGHVEQGMPHRRVPLPLSLVERLDLRNSYIAACVVGGGTVRIRVPPGSSERDVWFNALNEAHAANRGE